jgi:hypothetical protein
MIGINDFITYLEADLTIHEGTSGYLRGNDQYIRYYKPPVDFQQCSKANGDIHNLFISLQG